MSVRGKPDGVDDEGEDNGGDVAHPETIEDRLAPLIRFPTPVTQQGELDEPHEKKTEPVNEFSKHILLRNN